MLHGKALVNLHYLLHTRTDSLLSVMNPENLCIININYSVPGWHFSEPVFHTFHRLCPSNRVLVELEEVLPHSAQDLLLYTSSPPAAGSYSLIPGRMNVNWSASDNCRGQSYIIPENMFIATWNSLLIMRDVWNCQALFTRTEHPNTFTPTTHARRLEKKSVYKNCCPSLTAHHVTEVTFYQTPHSPF